MPRSPSKLPNYAMPCDPRLPQAALDFRLRHGLATAQFLAAINITAWLYRDKAGVEGIQVNPNTTIQELIRQFGRAETPDAETGFHSEMHAGEWFRLRPQFQVMQIFSERVPCRTCGHMLQAYFTGVPWYYYYDKRSWTDMSGKVIKYPADTLRIAYGL